MSTNEPTYSKLHNDDDSRPPSVNDSIAGAIAALTPMVDARVEWAHQDARARIDTHDAVAGIRVVGKLLRAVYQRNQVAAEVVRQRADLSPAGKSDALAKVAEEKAVGIAAVREALAHESARFLKDFPTPSLRPPTAQALANIELVRGAFSVALPADVEHDALRQLAIANDPNADGNAKHDALQLLTHAYRPMLRRRAEQPESFAKDRQQSAAVVSRLVSDHLDSVTGGPGHRLAAAAAGRVERTVNALVTMMDANGRWDDVLATTMAGELDWSAP